MLIAMKNQNATRQERVQGVPRDGAAEEKDYCERTSMRVGAWRLMHAAGAMGARLRRAEAPTRATAGA